MNGIGQKLRSDRGASITFALLLFLVCAVVSSVVIVAGTAAALALEDGCGVRNVDVDRLRRVLADDGAFLG